MFLNSKISCISTSFKKELIILLSNIAKKLQAWQFAQNCLSEKAPGSKYFLIFFDILKTDLVLDLKS